MALIRQTRQQPVMDIYLVDQGLVQYMGIFNIIMEKMAGQQVCTIQLEAVQLEILVVVVLGCGPGGGRLDIVHTLAAARSVS